MPGTRFLHDALIGHLARAVAVRHSRNIDEVMGEVSRFEWPEDDGLDQREALIRFMCGRIRFDPRGKRRSGP